MKSQVVTFNQEKALGPSRGLLHDCKTSRNLRQPSFQALLEARAEQLELECLPQLLVCCGFFFIYLVEELVDFILGKIRHSEPLHQTVAMRNPRNSVCAEESK